MPQLIIEQPGVPPRSVALTGEELHLGRAEDNTVALVADEVSRHHAKVVRRTAGFVLVDLNSLNGTYVNRTLIDGEVALRDSDEVQIGKFRLVYMVASSGRP